MDSLKNIVKDFRISKEMTQEEFSSRYGTTIHVVRDLEQGKVPQALIKLNVFLKNIGYEVTISKIENNQKEGVI